MAEKTEFEKDMENLKSLQEDGKLKYMLADYTLEEDERGKQGER